MSRVTVSYCRGPTSRMDESMDQGFSLTEVLLSLLLMTTTSLALLKQQWHVSQFLNQMYRRADALSQLDNATERLYLGDDAVSVKTLFSKKPFSIKLLSDNHSSTSMLNRLQSDPLLHEVHMKMTWASSTVASRSCCVIERRFVVGLGHE